MEPKVKVFDECGGHGFFHRCSDCRVAWMERSDQWKRLEGVFRDLFGSRLRTFEPSTTAAQVEGWDSVAHINLMFAIEEEFGIEFDGDEFAEFSDVGSLAEAVADMISR